MRQLEEFANQDLTARVAALEADQHTASHSAAGSWEWSGVYSLEAATYTWDFRKVGGMYGANDTSCKVFVHPAPAGLLTDSAVIETLAWSAATALESGSPVAISGGTTLIPGPRSPARLSQLCHMLLGRPDSSPFSFEPQRR